MIEALVFSASFSAHPCARFCCNNHPYTTNSSDRGCSRSHLGKFLALLFEHGHLKLDHFKVGPFVLPVVFLVKEQDPSLRWALFT
jgi:hypothetical protein